MATITKERQEETLINPLTNKKITIALVKRHQTNLYSDIETATLATGGEKSFMCPVDRHGSLKNPLTTSERKYLEDLLDLDLNVHKKEDNFWTSKKAMCRLRKTGKNTETANVTLDLLNPYDFILYKIALINPRVAKSWKERHDNKEYEFVIIDGAVEFEEELGFTLMENEVQKYLFKLEGSKRKLFDLLRMYGIQNASKQVNYASSAEWLFNELKKATRKPSEVKKLYHLIKLGEKDISSKVFVEDCVSIGLLEKRGFEYRLSGGDKIGNNEQDAISWFGDKRNSSVKARFEQMIEDYYEENK